MEDLLRQLFGYLRGMWLYRWWGLAFAWVVGIGAAVFIYQMPDRYESKARIYVDTQSVLTPLMRGLAIQPAIGQQVAILSRTLITRPNVEKLIRMADLDLGVRNDQERLALIERLMGSLRIQGTGRDNLYTLSFRDGEAARAKRVVQSLVTIFVESGLGDKRKDSDNARRFIEEQIRVYEGKLEEAENRRKEFKLKNMAFVGTGKADYFGQMNAMSDVLKQARLQLREAVQSRDSLRRQLLDEEAFASETAAPQTFATPQIDARIAALTQSMDAMLQRYTEAHPDVVGARRVIRQLEQQKKAEIEAQRQETPAGSVLSAANPVYQQLKVAIGSAEANVASLRARVTEYEGRFNALQAAAQRVPEIDAELSQLNRDYQIHQKNYNALVSRRESANMSMDLEATGVAEFKLIDPPTLPTKPAAPNRMLLMPMGGLAALGAGLALTFLLSQLRPTFQDGRTLRELAGLPLLGVITQLPDPKRRRRSRYSLLLFAGGVTSLVGSIAVVTVFLALLRSP